MEASYDRVAPRYVAKFANELDHKPFDRRFLEAMASAHRGGWLVDLGCGPSQIGAYLADRGAAILGIDLSWGMLREAHALRPDAVCVQADMRALPLADGSVHGLVAFYSLIHISPAELRSTLRELHRVSAAGGRIAIAVHIGSESRHADEMLGEPVNIDFYFFDPDQLVRDLESAGFTIESREERDPYPGGVEADTRRAYVVAVR